MYIHNSFLALVKLMSMLPSQSNDSPKDEATGRYKLAEFIHQKNKISGYG